MLVLEERVSTSDTEAVERNGADGPLGAGTRPMDMRGTGTALVSVKGAKAPLHDVTEESARNLKTSFVEGSRFGRCRQATFRWTVVQPAGVSCKVETTRVVVPTTDERGVVRSL